MVTLFGVLSPKIWGGGVFSPEIWSGFAVDALGSIPCWLQRYVVRFALSISLALCSEPRHRCVQGDIMYVFDAKPSFSKSLILKAV